MKARIYLFLVFSFCFSLEMASQIDGIVFRDFNGNGSRDNTASFSEPLVSGITVTAFPSTGSPVTTLTNSSGAYSFTGLSLPVRIEFSGLDGLDYSSVVGSGSQTSVQFYTSSTTTANFGINYPNDYCQANPTVAIPCYDVGPANGNYPALVRTPYLLNGAITSLATFGQIGATWGTAYHKETKTIFNSAFLKRHVGLAQGTGHIFMSHATSGFIGSFDLQGVNGIDLGSVTRTATGDNGINATTGGIDLDAFVKVGKVSFGDIDIYNQKTLFAVNLNSRSLIAVDVSNVSLLPTDGTAVSSSLVQEYTLSLPSCDGGIMRPFALKIHKGIGYLGTVCDASISENSSDLGAFVYTFDPENPGGGLTEVLSLDLNYPREDAGFFGTAGAYPSAWRPWKDVYAAQGERHVSPIFGDIEFAEDGSMIIGLSDRVGDQYGANAPIPVSGTTTLVDKFSAGDVLKACNINGVFVMEGTTGACPVNDQNPGGALLKNGTNAPDGYSGNGEFFWSEFYRRSDSGHGHGELALGGLAVLPGTKEVLTVMYDPLNFGQQGMARFSTVTGGRGGQIVLVNNPGPLNKANGLGDVELLCDAAPIQIGNRVWVDNNLNGVQDAGEAPISGVTVQLVKDGNVIATAITDTNGNYYFSSATGTSTASAIYGITELMPNMQYIVRIPNVQGSSKQAALGANSLTIANNDPTANGDARDSDGILVGDNADVTVMTSDITTAGANNHTFDFGFGPVCQLTITSATPSTCNPSNNEYTLTGTLTFTDAPTSGTLTVSISGGGSQVFTAPFTSPQAYSISGQTADGMMKTVTAVFGEDPACDASETFMAPDACLVLPCTMELSASPGACVPANNHYTLTGTVSYTNPPATGTLTVSMAGGGTQTFTAPFGSSVSYSISGLNSDGQTKVVSASFSDKSCAESSNYTAPQPCLCPTGRCGTVTVTQF